MSADRPTNGGAAPVDISLRGVSKEFVDRHTGERHRALDEITLDVHRGDFVCLVGPSGSGKSTLLNLIAVFEKPTSGTILVADSVVKSPGPDRVMVFQDYALFPWMNTVENVEFGLRVQGVSGADRRRQAMDCLRLVGLEHVATRPVYKLSGGMKQRVAIARALVLKPRALLMDEPFAALDAQQRGLLQKELTRIWQETRQTIVFVTHNLEEAIYLGNRIVMLTIDPGRIATIEVVDLPRPRDVTSSEFNEVKRRLGAQLEQEVLRSEQRRSAAVVAENRKWFWRS